MINNEKILKIVIIQLSFFLFLSTNLFSMDKGDFAKEVKKGFECGMVIENFNDIKIGDIIEFFDIEERKRTLDEVD